MLNTCQPYTFLHHALDTSQSIGNAPVNRRLRTPQQKLKGFGRELLFRMVVSSALSQPQALEQRGRGLTKHHLPQRLGCPLHTHVAANVDRIHGLGRKIVVPSMNWPGLRDRRSMPPMRIEAPRRTT